MNVRNWSKKSSGLTEWKWLYGVDKLRTFIVRSWCNRVEWLHGVGLCLLSCTVLYCTVLYDTRKLTLRVKKISKKWLWPVKVTLKVIKRRLKVFRFFADHVINKKNCRASVCHYESNEPNLASQFDRSISLKGSIEWHHFQPDGEYL